MLTFRVDLPRLASDRNRRNCKKTKRMLAKKPSIRLIYWRGRYFFLRAAFLVAFLAFLAAFFLAMANLLETKVSSRVTRAGVVIKANALSVARQ